MAGVTALAGLPGGGKSYMAVELFVLPALREGRKIMTNVPLLMDAVNRDFPGARVVLWDSIDAIDFDDVGDGCLLMLDEVWRLWPQGKSAKSIPVSELAVIKEHRHRSDSNGRSMDVVLICQDTGDIAAPIRGMIETTIISTKHLDLGVENAYRRDFYRGAVKGQEGSKQSLIRSENGTYKVSVYQYYKTHMGAMEGIKPDEKRTVRTSVFGSLRFKAGVVFFVLALGAFFYSANRTVSYVTDVTTKKPAQVVGLSDPSGSGGVVGEQIPSVPVNSTLLHYSKSWRIGGFIYNYSRPGQKPVFILVSTTNAQRLVYAEKCKRVDLEDYCEVDGEIVTRFSGRETPGYAGETESKQASQAVQVQDQRTSQGGQSGPVVNGRS